MSKYYILALDQGTTSSKAVIFNEKAEIVAMKNEHFEQIYPEPGWVEHNPDDIWETQMKVMNDVISEAGIRPEKINCIGITNQRETIILWDKNTGRPVYNAIVWQCRRTSHMCDDLKKRGLEPVIKAKTGLIIDPYFSATKIKWIFDNVSGVREKANRGEILAGTVDTWILWKLTGGKTHATDFSNASRTMLFNINTLKWDPELLKLFGVPESILPKVVLSSGKIGVTAKSVIGAKIPITGMAGDQQTALFGQGCFDKGLAKNTYGTGCFILMNTGNVPIASRNRLLTTIAWNVTGKPEYALEGSVFNAGAAVQWLREGLGFTMDENQADYYAEQVPDTGGVYVVPAYTGLGAPYWDPYARGLIIGLTRGTRKEHIIRATLESIAFQTRDVIEAMENDCGFKLKRLQADGGGSVNDFTMQFQSDIMGIEVSRSVITETTALGTAFLAGMATGIWRGKDEIRELHAQQTVFSPEMDDETRKLKYNGWKRAVGRAEKWER